MKRKRLIASILTAILVVMSLSTTFVNAANTEENTATVTIQNIPGTTGTSISGIAFALYQVFDLEVEDATEEESESITYTVNAAFEDFFDEVLGKSIGDYDVEAAYHDAALAYVNENKTYDDNGDVLENTMSDLVNDLREYIEDNNIKPVDTTASTPSSSGGVESITSAEVPYGYYLVLDADLTAAEDGIVPAGSLITVPGRSSIDGTLSADVVIEMKGSMPTINKEIWHNDLENADSDSSPTYGTAGSWDDVADYQIGDVVEFRITATVPSDLRGYTSETYTYLVTDTLSDGLSFVDGSLGIYTSPTLSSTSEMTGGAYHTLTMGSDTTDYTFQIDFDMYAISQMEGFSAYTTFYIYYQAVVTESAAIANDYESNTVTLKYSNNPYDETSTGEVEDTVYSYTFDLDILKTSGDGVTPLAGAKFALYEVTHDGTNQTLTQIYLALATNTEDTDGPQTYYPVNQVASSTTGIITTNASGEFDIVGLDDETTYMLKEIEAPEGYNAVEPVTFLIHADYSVDAYTGIPTPSISTSEEEFTFSADGSGLFGTIINTSNQLLPSTGGAGTTMFMIIGGVIMFGAVVLLVVRRKRNVA